MDAREMLRLCAQSDESDALKRAKEAVRTSLDQDERLAFRDMDADGTHYRCVGLRHGIGYTECDVYVDEDGLARVEGTCMPVAEDHQHDLAKLCRMWNDRFILTGLTVDENQLQFRSAPFDPTDGDMSASRAVHMVFSTFHDYASAPLALEAGVEAWELVDIDEACGGKDGGGGDSDDVRKKIDNLAHRLAAVEYMLLSK